MGDPLSRGLATASWCEPPSILPARGGTSSEAKWAPASFLDTWLLGSRGVVLMKLFPIGPLRLLAEKKRLDGAGWLGHERSSLGQGEPAAPLTALAYYQENLAWSLFAAHGQHTYYGDGV
jgi:hypothetical protein